ncbi:MAG: MFS transporter, partial [Armatimonadota bacterium]|nr:MFS transporter [Armatimonadota bacterium]
MTAPDTSSQTPPWRRLALVAYMFLTTAAFGFLQPFVPLYLAAAGLTAGKIGIALGVGTGTVLLVQPLLGHVSDFLDARRPLLVGAALIAGGAYAAYTLAPQHSLWAFLLLTCLGVNGTQYLNAGGGVLVGRIVGARSDGGAAYAGYRVWGSVGYIIVAIGTGLLVSRALGVHPGAHLDRAILSPVFTHGFGLFFALALAALL